MDADHLPTARPGETAITASWRPAPARGAVTGRIENGVLSLHSARGSLRWSIALDEVQAVRARISHVSGSSHYQLDLLDAGGRRRRIAINTRFAGQGQEERALDFLRHLLAGLERRKPDLPVVTGLTGPIRVVMFALGLAIAPLGFAVAWLALIWEDSLREALTGIATGLGLGLLGGGIVWLNRPWKTPSQVPLRDYLEANALLRAG